MSEVALRPMNESDLSEVVALVRAGFSTDRIARTIYGCFGVEQFLREQLVLSTSGYLVASTGSTIAGYVRFRNAAEICFIDYIVVAESYRGRGLGRLLLDRARSGSKAVRLDVYSDNLSALNFYKRLDFREIGTRGWYARAQLLDSTDASVPPPGAVEKLNRLGFTEYEYRPPLGIPLRIGVLGERYLRVWDSVDFLDEARLAFLPTVYGKREVLFLGSGVPVTLQIDSVVELESCG